MSAVDIKRAWSSGRGLLEQTGRESAGRVQMRAVRDGAGQGLSELARSAGGGCGLGLAAVTGDDEHVSRVLRRRR